MTRYVVAVLAVLLFASSSWAIETLTLVNRQGENDPSLLIGASDAQLKEYLPDGKLHSQILAFYVKFGDKAALFDAGLHDGKIVSELEKNGVKPEDVKLILITHLHPDHFGGLTDDEGKSEYPNAELYVSRPERDYWVNEIQDEVIIETLRSYTGRVHTFEFGDEPVEGVRAIDTAGHTPGHVSYQIDADGEKLLVVGDILHFIEIQLPAPDVAVRYDVDPVKAVQSRKFILDYASWKDIPIAGMHITPPGLIRVKKNDSGGYDKQAVQESESGI